MSYSSIERASSEESCTSQTENPSLLNQGSNTSSADCSPAVANPFAFSSQPIPIVGKSPSKSSKFVRQTSINSSIAELMEKLKDLQAVETELSRRSEAELDDLTRKILNDVVEMRERICAKIPTRLRQRIIANLETQPDERMVMKEINQLLGRCFNLSMNVKILGPAAMQPEANPDLAILDPMISERVLADLHILERSLVKRKSFRNDESELNNLLQGMTIQKPSLGGKRPNLKKLVINN